MKSAVSSHEDYGRKHKVDLPSERSFARTMTVAFIVLAGLSLWRGTHSWPYTLSISVLIAGCGIVYPKALYWPNYLWFRFGLLLHKITNPLFLGVLFFAAVAPLGIVLRLFGVIKMRTSPQSDLETYWIERTDHRYREGGFVNQF